MVSYLFQQGDYSDRIFFKLDYMIFFIKSKPVEFLFSKCSGFYFKPFERGLKFIGF